MCRSQLGCAVHYGIAQNVETTYDYELSDQYDFLTNWIISVSNTATPANVYSISWGEGENYLSTSFADVFNTELIKLGVMGTTVLASSGDDGVSSFEARGNPSFCGYSPLFPASSPYVVAVGGTNVSTYPLSPVDVLDIWCIKYRVSVFSPIMSCRVQSGTSPKSHASQESGATLRSFRPAAASPM